MHTHLEKTTLVVLHPRRGLYDHPCCRESSSFLVQVIYTNLSKSWLFIFNTKTIRYEFHPRFRPRNHNRALGQPSLDIETKMQNTHYCEHSSVTHTRQNDGQYSWLFYSPCWWRHRRCCILVQFIHPLRLRGKYFHYVKIPIFIGVIYRLDKCHTFEIVGVRSPIVPCTLRHCGVSCSFGRFLKTMEWEVLVLLFKGNNLQHQAELAYLNLDQKWHVSRQSLEGLFLLLFCISHAHHPWILSTSVPHDG